MTDKKIIDISFWQDPDKINYDLLASQIDGVIIRAAYGTSKDTKFETHYTEFKKRNVPVGAYHYILGNVSIPSQANAFLSYTAGKTLDLGLWMDVEDTRAGTKLSRKQVLDYAALVPSAGVYTSYYKWQEIMGGVYLNDRKLWVAHYKANKPTLPQGWADYWLWQYTSEGRLNGYNGNLDMNKAGTQSITPPDPEPSNPEVLYRAKVVTVSPNRLKTRRTPNGIERPQADWLQSGRVVDVSEVQGAWWRVGIARWASAQWLERIAEPDPETPVIDPEPEPTIPDGLLDVPHYSQTDPLWAQDIIGASNFNVGAKGCLLTITAAGLTFFGFQANPMAYNCLASSRGGYLITEENGKKYANMYWKFPDELTKGLIVRDEYQTFASGTGWESSANGILAKGKPVWCEVRLNNYQHWVLILGKVDGAYWILDPIDGAVKELDYPLVYRTVSYSKRGA